MSKMDLDELRVRSFKIKKKWILAIDRAAYWGREEKQAVLNKALEQYFSPFFEYLPEHPDELKNRNDI